MVYHGQLLEGSNNTTLQLGTTSNKEIHTP